MTEEDLSRRIESLRDDTREDVKELHGRIDSVEQNIARSLKDINTKLNTCVACPARDLQGTDIAALQSMGAIRKVALYIGLAVIFSVAWFALTGDKMGVIKLLAGHK